METIDALKEVPKFHFESHTHADANGKGEGDGDSNGKTTNGIETDDIDIVANNDNDNDNDKSSLNEATHINFFSWLRVMSQRYEMERIERKSAIRLMFETSSIGALTPNLPSTPEVDGTVFVIIIIIIIIVIIITIIIIIVFIVIIIRY